MNIELAKTINDEISKQAIPHQQFKEALDKSNKLLCRSDMGLTSSGFFLSGSSGTGKTTLLKTVYQSANNNHGANAVIYTTLTGSSNFTQTISSFLSAIGDPLPQNGTGKNKLDRLINGLILLNTKLLIIDEFQHLFAAKTVGQKVYNDTANAIKSVMDATNVSFLIAGTHEILQLWNFDEQLRTRFQSTSQISTFKYPHDKKEWIGIIKVFEAIIYKHNLTIDCKGLPHRLFTATHGNMRSVVSILKEAVVSTILKKSKIIAVHELDQATKIVIDTKDGNLKAFSDGIENIKSYAGSIKSNIDVAPRMPSIDAILSQSSS